MLLLSQGFLTTRDGFGTGFAERTPQSKTRIVYQAAQDIVTKLRKGKATELEGGNLQGVHLRGLKHDLPGRWLNFNGADLRRADLSNSQFRMVKFENANLERAKLQNAVWDLAVVRGANFKGAKMQGIKINTAIVDETDELVNVIFKNAKMQGAKISGKVNHLTDFIGARLQGADLSGVQYFGDAKLRGAVYNINTKLPSEITDVIAENLGMIKR